MSTPITVGDEFIVNTTTDGYQADPTIAALSDGGFIVTWVAVRTDGFGFNIIGQRYNSSGTANGGEFQINTSMGEHNHYPSVASFNDGGFVVTW